MSTADMNQVIQIALRLPPWHYSVIKGYLHRRCLDNARYEVCGESMYAAEPKTYIAENLNQWSNQHEKMENNVN